MRLPHGAGWKRWLSTLAVLSFALVWTGQAKAQDPSTVTIGCTTTATQTCTSASSTTPVASTTLVSNSEPTLSFSTSTVESGTAYVVVLVPATSSTSALSFSLKVGSTTISAQSGFDGSYWDGTPGSLIPTKGSGTAGGFLDLVNSSAGATGQFGPLTNVSALATGTTPSGFDVYVFDIGSYSCTNASSCPSTTFSVTGGSLPAGTVFWGYLTNSSGEVIDSTSNSNMVAVVPEPATLGLVGSGLLLLGLAIRRRKLAEF